MSTNRLLLLGSSKNPIRYRSKANNPTAKNMMMTLNFLRIDAPIAISKHH